MSEAKITLTAQDNTASAFDSVTQRLGNLHAAGEAVKGTLEAIGVTLSVGYFVELIKSSIEAGDHLANLNKVTDLSVEELSGLQLLAKQSGSDIDGLAKAVSRMQVEIGKAPDKFRELGITAATGTGALKQFSDIFALLPDINQRNALAQAVFQRSWQEMAPILAMGSARIQEAVDKGTQLSAMTTAQAQASEELNHKVAELTSTHGFLNQQVQTLLPLLTSLAETFVELQNETKAGDAEFHPLAETFRQLILFGGNVVYVVHGIGVEIGVLAAQANALAHADFSGFAKIHELATQDAVTARANFDAWEQKIMSTATALAVVGDTSDALSRRLAVSTRAEAQAATERAAAFLKAQQTTTDSLSQYDNLIKRIKERIDADNAALKAGRDLTEAEKFQIKAQDELNALLAKIPGLSRAAAEAIIAEARARDEDVAAMKRQQQNAIFYHNEDEDYKQAAIDLDKQMTDHTLQVNDALDDQTTSLTNINAQQQLQAQLLGATDQERALALHLLQIEQQRLIEIQKIERDNLLLDKESAKNKVNTNAAIAQQNALTAAGLEDQKQLMGQLTDLGKTLWDDLWSGGHNTLKKLGDDIKKFLIDELYQLVVKKWVFNIAANVTGGAAGGIANAAGSSLTSGIGSLLGGQLGGTGIAGIGGAIAGGYAAGATGSTAFATSLGVGNAGLGASGLAEMATAGEAVGAGGVAGGIGGAASAGLAAIPVVGWIGLAALAAYSIFGGKGGGPKTESGFGMGVPQRGDPSGATTMAQALQSDYAARANAIGVDPTLSNVGFFYAQDPQGTAKTQLQITAGSYDRAALTGGGPLGENVGRGENDLTNAVALADAQAELKNLQEKATGQLGDFLKTVNVTTASLGEMQSALDVATDVGALNHALAGLSDTFSTLSGLSVQSKEDLAKRFGGVQNLVAEMASFDDTFLTSQEKLTLQQKQLNAAFEQAGVTLPANIDAYKQAVLDAEKNIGSEAGDKTFATLINNAQAFYAVAQQTGDSIAGISDTMKSLLGDNAKLNVQLLTAKGDTTGASAAQFAIDTTGMSPAEIDQFKTNQALQQQINDITAANQKAVDVAKEHVQLQDQLNQLTLTNDQLLALQRDTLDASNQALFDEIQQVKAQQAADAAAATLQAAADQKAAAILQEKTSLQDQVNQLTMTSTQLLALQRAGIDASNQALFDQIQQIKAQQAADAAAAAHQATVGTERARLETQLLQLQGDTAALRQQELDAIQPENRALEEQILALEDAKAAEQKRTQKIQAATTALNQQKDSWHQLADTIGQESMRIHGELVGNGSAAAAAANLAILEARARAGDKSAAAQIPGASQLADTLAAGQAHSATQLALTRASMAFGLSQTSSIIDSAYGTASNAPVVDQLVTVNSTLRDLKKTLVESAATLKEIQSHVHDTKVNTRLAVDRGIPALNQPDGTLLLTGT